MMTNIELIKIIGTALSITLTILALYIRFWQKIDTTRLSADWALLFIASSGICTLLYFYNLTSYTQLLLRANLVLAAIALYICALIMWFWGVLKGARL